jgi:hypothetical protein
MIESELIATMRRSLGKTVEMKVEDRNITGKWNDIQFNTKTGLINGICVGEKIYLLNEIDYFRVK